MKKVQTSTTLMGNFMQNIHEHGEIEHITVHGIMDTKSDHNVNISNQFNIVSDPQTFICIWLEIIDENNKNNNNIMTIIMVKCMLHHLWLIICVEDIFY